MEPFTDISSEEISAATACLDAAAAGVSAERAEDCDLGSLGCPTCPWRDAFDEGIRKARNEAEQRKELPHSTNP